MPATLDPDLGTIDHGKTYTLSAFRAQTGMSDSAVRSARRAGLKVIRVGKRGFVRGSDFAAYLARLADGRPTA